MKSKISNNIHIYIIILIVFILIISFLVYHNIPDNDGNPLEKIAGKKFEDLEELKEECEEKNGERNCLYWLSFEVG
ncbi:MAG: hypothetical protein ABEK36_01085 [Candidatus Aenigmatarchaeota archaeon]